MRKWKIPHFHLQVIPHSDFLEAFQIMHVQNVPMLPKSAYASNFQILHFQVRTIHNVEDAAVQIMELFRLWNCPESGSCPKSNPRESKNVEGFQILPFQVGTVHNVEDGIVQNLEAAPSLTR